MARTADSPTVASSNSGATGWDRPLRLTPREDAVGFLGGLLGRWALFLIAATSVLSVLLIFVFIVMETADIPPISHESWFSFLTSCVTACWAAVASMATRLYDLLSSTQWYPEAQPPEFGALYIIVGSLYVSGTALVIAVPVGLLAAMCLSDILPFSVRQIAKPVVEILAAIPSVAFGFFAVLVIAPMMQDYLHITTGTNALNAAVMLAMMAVPTIVSVSEDALSAVGRELREASYACGATRAETLLGVVVPAAHSGIVAAIILGLMRAIGETMVVWMASGNATQIPSPWWDMTQSVRTITATIAGEMGETVQGSPHYRDLFGLGLFLLACTFLLNLATEHFLASLRPQAHAALPRRQTLLARLSARFLGREAR
jgi:phosphate transport system permease protein